MSANPKAGLNWLLAQIRSSDAATSRGARAVAEALALAVASSSDLQCDEL